MASIHLATARKTVTDLLPQTPKEFHGIVVSAGLMDKTVKVKLGGQRWEKKISKVSFILCSQAAISYSAAFRGTLPPLGIPQTSIMTDILRIFLPTFSTSSNLATL